MKNKLSKFGFLGLVGVAGLLLNSLQLTAFLLFFALFFAARAEEGEELKSVSYRAMKWSFATGLATTSCVFLLAAISEKLSIVIQDIPFDVLLSIMVAALSWCFAVTVAVFALTAGIGGFMLATKADGAKKRKS